MERRVRTVIADDVADLRAIVRRNLEMDGRFEVVGEAGDGEESVAVVESTRPDVIVLDIAMPRLSGLDAIPKIKEASPDTKILVFTVKGESIRDEVLAAGADDYLHKYTALDEVTARLARLAPGAESSAAD